MNALKRMEVANTNASIRLVATSVSAAMDLYSMRINMTVKKVRDTEYMCGKKNVWSSNE